MVDQNVYTVYDAFMNIITIIFIILPTIGFTSMRMIPPITYYMLRKHKIIPVASNIKPRPIDIPEHPPHATQDILYHMIDMRWTGIEEGSLDNRHGCLCEILVDINAGGVGEKFGVWG